MFWQIIAAILGAIAVLEIGYLIILVKEEKQGTIEENKIFVRFPGGKEYALTERTVYELQNAGVSIIVEQY